MEFSLLAGGENGEHSGVGLMEISKIISSQDTFFFYREQFKSV